METSGERIWILLSRKFSDSATEAEDAELQQLLRHHPDAQYTFEILQKLWKMPSGSAAVENEHHYVNNPVEYPDQGTADSIDEAANHFHIHRRVVLGISVAAAILFIAGALLFVFQYGFSRKSKMADIGIYTISTKAGEKKKIILPDGTHIWLNVATSLSYPTDFAKDSIRSVTLSGEAFFEVKHDEKHPFIIHTKNMDIRDIGTTFNVMSYPGEAITEASLISGMIEVTIHDNIERRIRLKPKEKIVIYRNKHFEKYGNTDSLKENVPVRDVLITGYSITQIKPDPTIQTFPETAWLQNDMVFTNQPFEELAKAMERKYAVKINITDNRIRQYQLTGVFRDETIEQALEELQIIAPFKYIIKDSSVTIY